jgi:hypothetical protein
MKKKIISFFVLLILFMLIFIIHDMFLGVGHSTNTKSFSEVYTDLFEYFWLSLIFPTAFLYFKSKEK